MKQPEIVVRSNPIISSFLNGQFLIFEAPNNYGRKLEFQISKVIKSCKTATPDRYRYRYRYSSPYNLIEIQINIVTTSRQCF